MCVEWLKANAEVITALATFAMAAVWLIVQAIGWTLLSIPLVFAPALLLPGFVQMLGTAIVTRAAETDR